MPLVLCDQISPGLRDSEAIATLKDHSGRKHFIRVERDFLTQQNGQSFLPVAVVQTDRKSQTVLIELPHEAETGVNRLWVDRNRFAEPVEVPA